MYLKIIVFFACIFPIFLLIACNYIASKIVFIKKKKIKGMDIALPFLIGGIFLLTSKAYNISYIPYYLLTIFSLGVLVAVVNVKFFSLLDFRRYIKMYWRISFVATFYIYILFAIMSVVSLIWQ